MKKFLHYGKEIMFQEGENSFTETLRSKGINFIELPITVPEIPNSYVIKYELDKCEKYAFIIPATETEKIYTMKQIPDDCDFYNVAIDELRQSEGENPMEMPTRAKMIIETAIKNVDEKGDPSKEKIDYGEIYYELIRLGCPIWEIERMDHHDVSDDWLKKVQDSNNKKTGGK